MNIYTVRDNLKNTIAGKEQYLADMRRHNYWERIGGQTKTEESLSKELETFLTINIDELKRILNDVEKCCEKATYDSWRENPDRMGGQFTQDEVDNAGKW